MDTPRDATKLRTTAPWAPSQQSLLLTLPIEILLTICEDDDLGFFDRVAFVGTCRSIREACGGAAFRDLTLTTKPDVFGQESRFQPPLKWHAAVLEKGRWNECVRSLDIPRSLTVFSPLINLMTSFSNLTALTFINGCASSYNQFSNHHYKLLHIAVKIPTLKHLDATIWPGDTHENSMLIRNPLSTKGKVKVKEIEAMIAEVERLAAEDSGEIHSVEVEHEAKKSNQKRKLARKAAVGRKRRRGKADLNGDGSEEVDQSPMVPEHESDVGETNFVITGGGRENGGLCKLQTLRLNMECASPFLVDPETGETSTRRSRFSCMDIYEDLARVMRLLRPVVCGDNAGELKELILEASLFKGSSTTGAWTYHSMGVYGERRVWEQMQGPIWELTGKEGVLKTVEVRMTGVPGYRERLVNWKDEVDGWERIEEEW